MKFDVIKELQNSEDKLSLDLTNEPFLMTNLLNK